MTAQKFKARPGVAMAIRPDAIGESFTPYRDDAKPYRIVDGVAVLKIEGPLVHKGSDAWWSCWDTYEGIARRFRDALEHDECTAVVLKFDSPGGEVAGCFETVERMQRLKARAGKPVVAYVDESCYSAAYALAMVADEIFLPRSGGVGSIGVITSRVDATKMDRKDGLRFDVIASGTKKTDGHPHVAITDDELRRTRHRIDRLAAQFFDVVGSSRGLSKEAVSGFEAGLFQGKEAVRARLADDVCSLDALLTSVKIMVSSKNPSPAGRSKGTDEMSLIKRTTAFQSAADALKAAKTSSEKREALASLKEAEKEMRAAFKKTTAKIEGVNYSASKDASASASASASEDESTGGSSESSDASSTDASASASASASMESSASSSSSSSPSTGAEEGESASTGLYTKDRLLRLCRQITGKRDLPEVMGALNAMGKTQKDLSSRVKRMESERDADAVSRLIKDGMRSGKLAPGQEKWARKQSPAALGAYLEATTEGLVTPLERARTEKTPASVTVSTPTDAMIKIWSSQGFTEKDYPALLAKHNESVSKGVATK